MFQRILILLLLFSFQSINAQIKLKTNVGDDLIETGMSTCEYDENWSKIFKLSDFGIGTDEQFHITRGEVGIIRSDSIFNFYYSVFKIDENFPESDPILIGGSWMYLPEINSPEIVQFELQNSIVVPAGVERILVEVGRNYSGNTQELIIAGTEDDTSDSWFRGCRENFTHILTSDLEDPVPNANFYITATGENFRLNSSGATTTLSHSLCDELIDPPTRGCSYGGMSWAREYTLSNFGVSTDEEFTINSGQVGISSVDNQSTIQFRIFEIDNNFPESFSENALIGESQVVTVNYFNSRNNNLAKIFNVNFETPVVIPPGVERILVQVYQTDSPVFPAATAQDDGSISWFKSYAGGCPPYEFTDIRDLGWPDIKLYINVTGDVKSLNNSFGMNFSNICSEFLKEFSLTNQEDIASVTWNFGDPASGAENISTDLSPFHDFTEDGIYSITATVKAKNGSSEVISENIDVKQPPKAYGIDNIEACESSPASGLSTAFDTSTIESQVLKDQTDKMVIYIDGSGNEYETLPNPFSNTIAGRETIRVRVSKNNEPCCYDETSFDLIVNPLPDFSELEDLYACDTNDDGFSEFDLTPMQSSISENNTEVEFYFQDGEQIPDAELSSVSNRVQGQEVITVRATNTVTGCYNESEFSLISVKQPIAFDLEDLTACDDNKDGISEYFDTSEIEDLVLGDQSGMEVSYFYENGDELPGTLPDPYTNTKPNQEILTVRVTNFESGCFSETLLRLKTSSQPQINKPEDLYACNSGEGFAFFDTSKIETQLIGSQPGLSVQYMDENGNEIPAPISENYQNSIPWKETIFIRVESEVSSICYSETSFDLIVNQLPEVNLSEEYFLCDLEPNLHLNTSQEFDTWIWTYEDGTVISNSFEADVTDAGNYTLKVSKTENGISCENTFSFKLVRSVLPTIDEVKIQDISDNNYLEIITSGDGEFEYSINGSDYQERNSFYDLKGGIYMVEVRDKNGCGTDRKEVVLVDYPKILTPNNDGYNDFWQIDAVHRFPESKIMIYDRYGKLLKELTAQDKGWDGTFNGKQMQSDDYWFTVFLSDGRNFKGHFSLVHSVNN